MRLAALLPHLMSQRSVILMVLEVLDRALVSLRGFPGTKGSKVAAAAGFGVLLTRVQAVLAGFQFSDHSTPHVASMPGDGRG